MVLTSSFSDDRRNGWGWLRNARIGLETIHVAIESSNINSSIKHCRGRIDVVADLYFRNLFAIFSGQHVNPTRFIAKDDAAIDDRRRAPDRSARFESPNQFAFVRAQAMQVTIAGADVNLAVGNNWAGPDADALTAAPVMPTLGCVLPG